MTKTDLIAELNEMLDLDIATPAAVHRAENLTQDEIDADFVGMSVSEAADLIVSLS